MEYCVTQAGERPCQSSFHMLCPQVSRRNWCSSCDASASLGRSCWLQRWKQNSASRVI